MNGTSRLLFSISVCVVVLFWRWWRRELFSQGSSHMASIKCLFRNLCRSEPHFSTNFLPTSVGFCAFQFRRTQWSVYRRSSLQLLPLSKTHIRSRAQYFRRQVSREGFVETPQNKMILKKLRSTFNSGG